MDQLKMDLDPIASMKKEEDYRVKLTSKTIVVEQIKKYKELLKKMLDGQTQIPENAKQELLQELLTNFETTVQDNVLINDLPWEDAPDEAAHGTVEQRREVEGVREEKLEVVIDESCELAGLLDESIVETTRKRHKYPKKILPHVVCSLKAERKLMGMYEQVVKPQEVGKDPVHETIMTNLSDSAPRVFKQASAVMKSLQVLQQQAEGLRQVLDMQPTAESLEVDRVVFGHVQPLGAGEGVAPPPDRGALTRQTIRRAVQEMEARDSYAPARKIPAISNCCDKPE